MKMIQKITVLLLALLSIQTSLQAQTKKNTQPTFTGTIKHADSTKAGFDSITVAFFRPNCPEGIVGEEIMVKADKDGHFSFKLPQYRGISRMAFWTYYNGRHLSGTGFLHYLIEQNDAVKIELIKNIASKTASVNFSGPGSEKYNLANQLEKIAATRGPAGSFRLEFAKLGFDEPHNFKTKLEQYALLTEKNELEKMALINTSDLTPRLKKMMIYNYGAIYHDWSWMLYSYLDKYKNDAQLTAMSKESFNKNKMRFSYPYDPLMGDCANYLSNLAGLESRGLVLASSTGRADLKEYYHILERKYSGLTRELLIANLGLKKRGWIPEMGVNNKLIDSLLLAGEKYITLPFVKAVYTAKVRLIAGMPLFNGYFKDVNGKEIVLASLKGKVLFIDMWFTGCTACAEFHKSFHKDVYPLLKDNKAFLYVSLCIDKNNQQWLNSVKSGKYTSNDYLNLNSTRGIEDAFFKYYSISAFPFTLLVDKEGRIYSGNMDASPQSAIRLIKEALSK